MFYRRPCTLNTLFIRFLYPLQRPAVRKPFNLLRNASSRAPKTITYSRNSKPQYLSTPRSLLNDRAPPIHIILYTGIKTVLRPLAQPSRLLRFLIHLTIACYFFQHYVAGWRPTNGPSMLPTLNTTGDAVVVCWLYAQGHGVKTGDLVSYKHPVLRGEFAIKRVMALEGDYVLRDTPGGLTGELGNLEGWGQSEGGQEQGNPRDQVMVQVPKGHCWLTGDNLSWSRDSRMYGPVPLALVRGRVVAIKKAGWPWEGWSVI